MLSDKRHCASLMALVFFFNVYKTFVFLVGYEVLNSIKYGIIVL